MLALLFLGCAAKNPAPAAAASGVEGVCNENVYEPSSIPEAMRYHYGATALADASTSKEKPVEVCSVEGELLWLLNATCSDGSHPFTDGGVAHAAREGNVGPGGRCGRIVDLYNVPCPEGRYAIYMDMYACD